MFSILGRGLFLAIFGYFSEGTGWRRFECEPVNPRGGSAVPTGLFFSCIINIDFERMQP